MQVSLLVHDLITTEVWKSQIFDVIAKTDFCPTTTIPLYLVVSVKLRSAKRAKICVEIFANLVLVKMDFDLI